MDVETSAPEDTPEIVTIQELAEETKTKPSFWYELSRRDAIPGQIRIGRHIRIDKKAFYRAVRVGTSETR